VAGRVTAFEMNHGDAIKPAFGYRIDSAADQELS
jgi:hypothetical protein